MNLSRILIPLIFLFTSQFQIGLAQKIAGVNFVAEKSAVSVNGFDQLKRINSNWVSWVPYAYCDVKTGNIHQSTKWQWEGESLTGTEKAIKLARDKGLKIMIKPHIWLSDHSFGGRLQMADTNWINWQEDYAHYILTFAQLAEKYQVELFCIGTEQEASTKKNPIFWQNLIQGTREIYSGKITYAANWDEYTRVPFWKELDYIGIDAYFPISTKANPSIIELEKKWNKWKSEIYATYSIYKLPILFTEFGYRTTEYTTKKPWEDVTIDTYCESCQANALQANFNTFWNEQWIAGGFIWKWFEPNKSVRHENEKSFFIKGKLAEEIVAKNYELFLK